MNTDKSTDRWFSQWPSVLISVIISVICVFSCAISVWADTKQWSGSYDALSWDNDANWFLSGVPALADDVIIDLQGATVDISNYTKGFKAKSLTIGGRTDSTVTFGNFVYGIIATDNDTDNALYIRNGGTVIAQGGGGTVTLKGKLKFLRAVIPDEPAFMFGAE